MNKLKVAPSILSADFAAMGAAVENLEKWNADWVHCDVMDGKFVPNITFGMPMVAALRKHTKLTLDVHLMIENPENYVKRFVEAGADIVTFHPEASACPEETLKAIRDMGAKCGIVLNPDIPVSVAEKFIDMVDVVMLMGVFPGFGGQKFIPEVLDKIAELKKLIGERDIILELDGGVTLENVAQMHALGLDMAVGGSCVFNAQNPEEAIKTIQNS